MIEGERNRCLQPGGLDTDLAELELNLFQFTARDVT